MWRVTKHYCKQTIRVVLLKPVQNERITNILWVFLCSVKRVHSSTAGSAMFSQSVVSDGVVVNICNGPFYNVLRPYLNTMFSSSRIDMHLKMTNTRCYGPQYHQTSHRVTSYCVVTSKIGWSFHRCRVYRRRKGTYHCSGKHNRQAYFDPCMAGTRPSLNVYYVTRGTRTGHL